MEAEPKHRVWRPWATYGLIGVVALVWVAMTAWGGSLDATENSEILAHWGAATRPDLFMDGEYWRLLTANFIHIGLVHVAVNGYSLWVAGPAIEALYGPWQLVYFYVTAGVLSAVTSAVLGPPAVLSAGASGAIYGLLGAIVWYRLSSPLGFRIRWRPLVMTLVLNLGLALSLSKYLDNWAHIGGLVGGFIAAALLGVPVVEGWPLPRLYLGKWMHRALAGVLLLFAAAVTAGWVPLPGPGRDLARSYQALEAQRWDEAEAGIHRAIRREPEEPSLRLNLTLAYLWQGKCTDAATEYRQLTALAPDDPQVINLGKAVDACRP